MTRTSIQALLPNRAHEAPAVEHGHAHVQQDQRRTWRATSASASRAVGRGDDREALEVERLGHRGQDRRIVVDDQDRRQRSMPRLSARFMRPRARQRQGDAERAARPGVLSTQMRPPCSATIPRAMYSPSPMPGEAPVVDVPAAVKALEDQRLILERNANTVVGHAEAGFLARARDAHLDGAWSDCTSARFRSGCRYLVEARRVDRRDHRRVTSATPRAAAGEPSRVAALTSARPGPSRCARRSVRPAPAARRRAARAPGRAGADSAVATREPGAIGGRRRIAVDASLSTCACVTMPVSGVLRSCAADERKSSFSRAASSRARTLASSSIRARLSSTTAAWSASSCTSSRSLLAKHRRALGIDQQRPEAFAIGADGRAQGQPARCTARRRPYRPSARAAR